MRIKVPATYSFAAVSHFPPFIFMEMNRGSYGIRNEPCIDFRDSVTMECVVAKLCIAYMGHFFIVKPVVLDMTNKVWGKTSAREKICFCLHKSWVTKSGPNVCYPLE